MNTSLDSIVTRLQTLKASSDAMLANSQGLNFDFTHERELNFSRGNASAATAFLSRVNSAFSNATLQRREIDAISGNVTDLQGARNDRSGNVTALQNEVVAEQERLRLLLSNITAVQVGPDLNSINFKNYFVYYI